jgi:hypothetical protein
MMTKTVTPKAKLLAALRKYESTLEAAVKAREHGAKTLAGFYGTILAEQQRAIDDLCDQLRPTE